MLVKEIDDGLTIIPELIQATYRRSQLSMKGIRQLKSLEELCGQATKWNLKPVTKFSPPRLLCNLGDHATSPNVYQPYLIIERAREVAYQLKVP